MVGTFRSESRTDTACLVCGGSTETDPGLCSTHCRAEADLEIRHNRRRLRELRQAGDANGRHGREIRGILDRNATLDLALINSAASLRSHER